MAARAVVVGAGLAGLHAALRLREAGLPVTVLEASPHVGGRCRSYSDAELGLIDNGTHALTAANPVALSLVAQLGLSARWARPPGGALQLVDLAERRVFEVGARIRDLRALGLRPQHGLAFLGRDRAVGALFDHAAPAYRRFIEPLTVAALNTAPSRASSKLLARVLAEGWRGSKALIPMVAERGLGPDLVEPLADEVRRRGAIIETSTRVRGLGFAADRVVSLDTRDGALAVGEDDRVVLAVPPAECERLTGLWFGFEDSPIVNAHFAVGETPGTTPIFVGVIGGTAQWILWRGAIMAVTVSAADDLVGEPSAMIAELLWRDVRDVIELATGRKLADAHAHRIVKERRATIRQTPGLVRPGAETAWRNVVLAGDWTDTGLPATIEGALRSGATAARTALR